MKTISTISIDTNLKEQIFQYLKKREAVNFSQLITNLLKKFLEEHNND